MCCKSPELRLQRFPDSRRQKVVFFLLEESFHDFHSSSFNGYHVAAV